MMRAILAIGLLLLLPALSLAEAGAESGQAQAPATTTIQPQATPTVEPPAPIHRDTEDQSWSNVKALWG